MDEKLARVIEGANPDNTSVLNGIGPGDDAVVLMMQSLEADLEAEGWDQPANVFAVFSFPEALGMRSLMMPDAVLQDMSEYLPVLVKALEEDCEGRELFARLLPENFFGVVLHNEGWSVRHDAPNAVEASFTRQLQYHPDRVEMRFAICYTLDGRMVNVFRRRGELPETVEEAPQEYSGSKIPVLAKRLAEVCKTLAPSFVIERQVL